ncbi:restriction endonuclease subunit S [Acidithiobacillus thiooxidans]|nr:restriction endonuclease subunit S [Acidithiobacillus thiooxidans]MBU2812639.1 restriction endonuclease subunit S [Acidithiobacillus thiooxidans]
MRDGWDVKPLKEVCLIKPPKSEARKGQNADFLVSFAPMETLGIDQKYLITNQTRTMSDVIGSYTYFTNGDVLLAKITPCFENGKLGIASDLINNIGFGSSEYIVFRANEQLDAEWLYYYLSRQSFRNEGASRMAGAVGHKRITKDFIEDYPIPIPPLPEQRRIVAILDEAFEGIATAKANAEKNLQNAREVFESHLNAVFSQRGEGWVEKRLGDVCRRITVGHVGPMAKRYKSNGIPFLRSQNIRPFSIDLDNVVFIDEAFHSSLAKSSLEVGDIAIVRTGYPGTAAVIPESLGIANCSDLVIVRPGIDIDAHFLAAFFNSQYGKQLVLGKIVGAAQKHFNVSAAKETVIYIPPVTEQLEIIRAANEMREETQHLESLYQHKLAALDELKQSLLHQAFNGGL